MAALLPGGGGGVGGGGSGGDSLLATITPMAATYLGYKGTPATGTGIKGILKFGKSAGLSNPVTVHAIVPDMASAFGGYPADNAQERGPDGLFIASFALMFIVFMSMWVINTSRRHNFHLFLGIGFYCAMKIIGFSCRIAWSHNPGFLEAGICSLVFIQVGPSILESMNMVLAHRVFTWRHPEIGKHWSVVIFLDSVYFIVVGIIVMAILGQGSPYIYFSNQYHYNSCKNVMKAASVLNLFYAAQPFQFLALAYYMPAGKLSRIPQMSNRLTGRPDTVPMIYQPTWIRSASLFYYPSKDSQVPSYKGEPGENAIRIIASRDPPGHKSIGPKPNPEAPHMHWATLTVVLSSFLLTLSTCFRVAACFRTDKWGHLDGQRWVVNHWVDNAYVMFIFYGGIEFVVSLIFLIMRVDLRFYIPDMARKRRSGDPHNWIEGGELEKSYESHLSKSSNDVTNPGSEINQQGP